MKNTKLAKRLKRKKRIRVKVRGTAQRPRLSVFKSLRYLYAQLIDDEAGKTLAEVSTVKAKSGKNIQAAKEVGKVMAEKARGLKIECVTFDRNGYQFHGVVRSIADAAREGGLKF